MVYRKPASRTLLVLVLVLLAASLFSASAASASHPKTLRYRIVGHGRMYDKVRRHHSVLRIRHRERYVMVHGAPRYRVVRRTRHSILLRKASASVVAASRNTTILRATSVSVGLPASASSAQSGKSALAANDGQGTTRWASDSRTYPQWWMVDLGAVTSVAGIESNWYNAAKRAYRYRIETSLDGSSFTTVADRSGNVTKGATTDALAVTARYVRVQVLGVSSNSGSASANEITVYAEATPSPPPSPEPTPSATVTPSPSPTAPAVTPTPSPTAPAVTPTPSPTAPAVTPTPSPTAPTVTPTPSPTASVADYYVSTTGNDTTGNGSSSNPWRTIQKAANSMTAGKAVSVAAGTYNERVTIPSGKSGVAGATTRLIASGRVVVAQGFEVNSSYTDIEGFEITPGSTAVTDADYRGQIWVRNANVSLKRLNFHDLNRAAAICLGSSAPVANRTLIEDCTFTRVPWNAISVDNGGSGTHPSDVTVRRCTVSKFQGHQGIKAYGDRWLVEDCSIQGPAISEITRTTVDGDGLQVNFSSGTIIRRTKIFDVWQHVTYTGNGYHTDGIQFWDTVTNLLIDGCTIGGWKPGGHDNSPGPMNSIMAGTVNSNCSVTIENSLLMSGIQSGIQANTHTGCGNADSTHTLTIHLNNNTFFGNFPAWVGNNTTVEAHNNVFYSHRGSYSTGSSSTDHNAFLWNLWTDQSVSNGAPQGSSVAASEGAHSLGRTSATRLSAADIFVNPDVSATTDYGLNASFRPKPGSVLIGAADPAYAPDHDITGAPRSRTAPSIGAYE